MVEVPAGSEVTGEAAAGAGGDAVCTQRGDGDQGEVAAGPGQSLGRQARLDERSRVGREEAVQDLAGRAKVTGSRVSGSRFVDQEPLYGDDQVGQRGR